MEQNETLKTHYIRYVNEHQQRPVSVAAFSKETGITEEEFYRQYASLHHLEDVIWKDVIDEVTEKLASDLTYQGYSVREKLLAFYFAFFDALKDKRGFASYTFRLSGMHEAYRLSRFRKRVREHMQELVGEGVASGEIPQRLNIHRFYPDAGFVQLLGLCRFWVADESASYEKTDEAVEKSVNWIMDLISRNGLDSGIELARFIFRNTWK